MSPFAGRRSQGPRAALRGMTARASARPVPWTLLVSEMVGTALLVLVGLSLVIVMFGAGTRWRACFPTKG